MPANARSTGHSTARSTASGPAWALMRALSLALALALALPAAAQPVDADARRLKPGWALQQATPDGDSVLLDGRVRPRDGELLSGTGQFKFVLYRRDGGGAERQFWNNARGRVAGLVAEPDASVNVPVRAGRFSIRLGDEVSTPPLPVLDDARIALPTPWVRIWWREPDGVFRVLAPDLPIDAAPLAREAALAADADRLGGRDPDHYLSRLNHVGPDPKVDFVQVFHPNFRRLPRTGCHEIKVELPVTVPADGVLVVQGHANIAGVVRAGGGNCGATTVAAEVCPPEPATPAAPDVPAPPGAPALPAPPAVSVPTPAAPAASPPPLPGLRGATGQRSLPPPPGCIAGEWDMGFGTRSDQMGGRGALLLLRKDLADPLEQRLSWTGIEFQPDVLVGRRMDVSSTFAVQKGFVRLEMIATNSSFGGFSEYNLTAMFFPTRANSSRPAP